MTIVVTQHPCRARKHLLDLPLPWPQRLVVLFLQLLVELCHDHVGIVLHRALMFL